MQLPDEGVLLVSSQRGPRVMQVAASDVQDLGGSLGSFLREFVSVCPFG